MLTVSKTYDTITEESAEQGDFADNGYVFHDEQWLIKDVVRLIKNDGFTELSSGNAEICKHSAKIHSITLGTTSPDHDRDYFEKGIEKYYHLHIKGKGKYLYKLLLATKLIKEVSI